MRDQLSGTFLTIALILSNYTSDIFGKDFNNLINKNYMIKLFILYILIFMTIRYESDYPNHIIHFMRTNIIFVIFLMAVKTNTKILITVIILSILNRLVDHHLEYLEENKQNENDEYKKLTKISNLLTYTIIGISIVGFLYEIFKRSQKDNFSLYKFITTQN
tara:strand:- start:995 stop:1480 length:486 start_codon:yes stop_codon:yes gene_type:complete